LFDKRLSAVTVAANLSFRSGRRWAAGSLIERNRGVLISVGFFLALFALITALSPRGLTYFSMTSLLNAGAALALASIGQTLVILCGGFDLSAGSTVAFANAILVTRMQDSIGSELGWCLAVLIIGAIIGLINGAIIAFFRMQPIIVTLSMMFLVRGATLLILPSPGGSVPESLSDMLVGDAVPGVVPAALIIVLAALGVWFAIKGSRLGTAIFAVGSDETAAHAVGIGVRKTKLAAYAIAGASYAMGGIVLTAQSGAGDPLIGNPFLLGTFTAVVLGGTLLRGGRGGCVGSVFGAYTLLAMTNVLFALKISEYYSSIAEALVLLIAVLLNSMDRQSVLAATLNRLRAGLRTHWAASSPPTHKFAAAPGWAHEVQQLVDTDNRGIRFWKTPYPDWLRFVAPAWIVLLIICVGTALMFGDSFSFGYYANRVLILAVFPAILALGQGIVIMAGGFDLSPPWAIAFCGVVSGALINGSESAVLWVVPLVLIIGMTIGGFNGVGVAFLGVPPIVMTLATNGLLQGASMILSNGMPQGYASEGLRWFVTGSVLGLAPVTFLLAFFTVAATALLAATPFARKVIAVGTNARVAELSGTPVQWTVVATYVVSGVCSALVAVILVGLLGQASLDMGQDYLLPSIAAVVVGGTLITGGRGHYLGMLGGVLVLTTLQIFLAGTALPFAVRDIVFGLVVMAAVLTLRERSGG
jgi:ribose transport system permease protein